MGLWGHLLLWHVHVYFLNVLYGLYFTTWAADENREYFSIPHVPATHLSPCNNLPSQKFLFFPLTWWLLWWLGVGAIESGVSSSQGCHRVRDVVESGVSSSQGCHRVRGVIESGIIESGISWSNVYHWVRGVIEALVSRCNGDKSATDLGLAFSQWYHLVECITESGVLLSQGCHWSGRSMC
jgi:hypothetical protein